jgi:hypothetical protein
MTRGQLTICIIEGDYYLSFNKAVRSIGLIVDSKQKRGLKNTGYNERGLSLNTRL